MTATCVIAIDAGTTGVRSRAVFTDGRPASGSYREFTQHFPQPGWVEHDADEIWAAARDTLNHVIADVGIDTLAAIDKFGISDKVSYISTGGGAFLEYVEGKILPAVAMLEQRAGQKPE